MPRFSLRQIFIAVVALAIGLSIARLPKGSWVDVPLATLGFYFVLGLWRQATATRRLLREHPELPREQRWGGRLLIAELFGALLALVVALVFSYLAAAGLTLPPPKHDSICYLDLRALPRDLAILVMLVATGLSSRASSPANVFGAGQAIYALVAAGGTLFAIIVYWVAGMLVWYLVYLAICGVEIAQSPSVLSPEMNLSTAVRMHRFAVGSFAGLACLFANGLLIGGLVKWWGKYRRRWALATFLAGGLTAECWIARWIIVDGIRQLAPPLNEVIAVTPVAASVVVGTMIVFTIAAFSCRMLAKPVPVSCPARAQASPWFLPESWLGCLLLGVVGTMSLMDTLIRVIVGFWRQGYRHPLTHPDLWDNLTTYPARLIALASAIGGFAMAWSRWRRRKESVADLLPCIDPALFAVTMVSLLILVLASAPIIAAVSFSYWLVQLGGAS